MVHMGDERDIAQGGGCHRREPAEATAEAGDEELVEIVLVVIVLIERDAVLLRDGGVLVVLRGGTMFLLTGSEPEGLRPGLLQLARFFEAAMTTLFHGRAPTSVR
jgi:hypothetical protein